jgi:origin recognition complex subunit 4
MAYDEYSSLVSKHKIRSSAGGTHAGIGALGAGAGAKVWGREVALRSWERLVDGELLITAGLGAGTGGAAGGAGGALAGREGGMEFRMWRVDVALDEIPDCFEGGLGGMVGRWCREI